MLALAPRVRSWSAFLRRALAAARRAARRAGAHAHAFAGTLTEAAKKVSALPCDDDPRARAAKGKVVRELLSLKCRGLGASERVCERAEALEHNVEELRKAVHAINPELIGVPTSELLAGRPVYFPRKGPVR